MLIIKKTTEHKGITYDWVRQLNTISIIHTDKGFSFFVGYNENDFFRIDLPVERSVEYISTRELVVNLINNLIEHFFHEHFSEAVTTTLDVELLKEGFIDEVKILHSYLKDCEDEIKEDADKKQRTVMEHLVIELTGFLDSYEEAIVSKRVQKF